MAKTTKKKRIITRILESILNEVNNVLTIFFKDLIFETLFKGLKTLSTLKEFKSNDLLIFYNKLVTIIMKSIIFQLSLK